ncbi:hypothetical protein HUG15_16285 [Salicibibacter cibarius]|uniref:Uncharacterized protein n=1 Tax=Salicibibacter cibarius TaxID=2743000 RepID=A0A7T6Z5A5_9BACI|nr:hypothetical protein HUG15_16285 [Salicibibacter cibarius]
MSKREGGAATRDYFVSRIDTDDLIHHNGDRDYFSRHLDYTEKVIPSPVNRPREEDYFPKQPPPLLCGVAHREPRS